MTSQAAIFGETIAAMKKALKRKAYDSDSDSSIEHLTNRGNKLRKKARYVHEGQLAAPTGPQVYKRTIEHAGYYRDIISFNPPIIDEDGYEVDSDDDEEKVQAAMAAAAEFDPYAEVKVEQLLAPLRSASDLPNHPTLSKPFTSKTLTELTRHAGEMVQKEKASLWRIKHLLTRLSGDNTWIPCESVETEHDFDLFLDERDRPQSDVLGKSIARDGDQLSTGTLASEDGSALLAIEGRSRDSPLNMAKLPLNQASIDGDTVMGSADTHTSSDGQQNALDGRRIQARENGIIPERVQSADEIPVNGKMIETAPGNGQAVLEVAEIPEIEEGTENAEATVPRRMRTRAQAQAASDNTASSRARSGSLDSGEENYIHPYFLAPASSRLHRDLGLPQSEANDIRKLLQLYIQKQEEVCRGVEKVYDGLLKADRYRNLVMKWCKAEAHVGANRDMSDGEDWYDKEEWGLDEDLKKGQDEEEEDAATTAKKTRTRRQ